MKRALLVEDDADIRTITQVALEVAGWQVDTAEHGRQAFDRLVAGATYDVVLLDALMPTMTGLQFLAAVREVPDLDGLRVIALTANVQPHQRRLYIEAGCVGIVPKPFDPLVIAEQIESMLG